MDWNKYLTAIPYAYQQVGIEFGTDHNYVLIGDEMGLGKTLQALGIVTITNKKRVLIVCPAFLRLNWLDEIEKFVVDKTIQFEVVSYEKAKNSEELFKWCDAVIIDEIHYLKNKDTQRTKAIHQYVMDHRPTRVIGLSGTPITNRVPDWFSLLVLMSYNPYNNNGIKMNNVSYWDFCNKFCNVRYKRIRGRNLPDYYGHKNVEGIKRLLKDKYIRRLCKDVLDLSEILEQEVTISKDNLDEDSLDNMKDAEVEGVWIKIKKESAISKASYAVSFIDDLCENGPVVVFSDHRSPVDIISSGLIGKKRKVKVITGDTPMEDRHRIVKFFQDGRLDAVVCTIGAASTGITLTKSCQIVFNDLSASPANNAQAIKRVHRIGQDKLVRAYFLTSNKIDKQMTYMLRQKIKSIREVV